MTVPPNGAGPAPGAASPTELAAAAASAVRPSALRRLAETRWFVPGVLVATALAAGLLLGPSLGSPAYPTDPALVGTPASEKIKAPFDFEVTDEETTERLREEAVTRVPRAYDLDVRLAETQSQRLIATLRIIAAARTGFIGAHPEYAQPELLSRTALARLDEAFARALEASWPEVEATLELSLSPAERTAVARLDAAVGDGLAKALASVQSEAIVASRGALAADRELGLTIQHVPDRGIPDRLVADIDTIADLAAARVQMGEATAASLSGLAPGEREALLGLCQRLVRSNLTLNLRATEIAREVARVSVNPVAVAFKEGEVLIRDGERITSRHLAVFRELGLRSGGKPKTVVALGGGLLVLVLIGVALSVGRGRGLALPVGARDLVFLSCLLLLVLLGARLWVLLLAEVHDALAAVPAKQLAFLLPVAAAAMITRMVRGREVAIGFAVVSSMIVGMMIEVDQVFLAFLMVGSVLGATALQTMSRRSDLLRAGVLIGVAQAAAVVAALLGAAVTSPVAYLTAASSAFVGGLLAAIVALALTSVAEISFGYTTDLKLLELANLNHPALKALIVQAPGSYHHSVIVGSLVEAAAEEIGANPLLARVMAYYHDIGKGENPTYFVENQRGGNNPHNKLKPSMSAMVLRRHVTDGLELARRYGLGEQIEAGIAEHHGTTLMQFFFQRAKETEDESNPVSELDYRYNGRKPQSREAALVMLADAVEAATRSLEDTSPARVAGAINRVINLKFTDGQLEECDLTLKDLHAIAKAFTRVVNSIYHERPEYPEAPAEHGGKRPDGDLDSKARREEGVDGEDPERGAENLRRLGLD